MKFIKSKEFIFIVGGFSLFNLLIWTVIAIERGFYEFWWLMFITMPFDIVSVAFAHALYVDNRIYSKPIDYTLIIKFQTKTKVYSVFEPSEKILYIIFKIVYKDGTSIDRKVEDNTEEYKKLMRYVRFSDQANPTK